VDEVGRDYRDDMIPTAASGVINVLVDLRDQVLKGRAALTPE
jgi:hypothetical protein